MAGNGPYRRRLQRAWELVQPLEVEGLLVTSLASIRYLTGFSGSAAMLIVHPDGPTLLTDSRYQEQAALEAPVARLAPVGRGKSYEEALTATLAGLGPVALAYEEVHLRVAQLHWLEKTLPAVRLVPSRRVVEGLRAVKDVEEIGSLRRSASGLEGVLAGWRVLLRPGVSERELAAELDLRLRRAGYDKPSFETIVASGPRSAMPHGRPTGRELGEGELVVVDFGGFLEGYASDITRTFCLGPPAPELARIYEIVRAAQQAAIDRVRTGVPAQEIDRAAREVIEAAGYGEQFGHGTGHGLGLEVHEEPWVRPASETVLQAGMVLTVEPGVYVPGRGGVRLEDDVLVTESGREVLSRAEGGLREFSWVC